MSEPTPRVSIVTAPAGDPVSVGEAKNQCRIEDDITDDDAHIRRLIVAATNEVEELTKRALISRTIDVVYDWFPEAMEIPLAPLASIGSVKYIDPDGAEQTLATAMWTLINDDKNPAVIRAAYEQVWPDIRSYPGGVTVRATVGYGTASQVPDELRSAVLLLVEANYDRDPKAYDMMIKAAERCLERHKVHYF